MQIIRLESTLIPNTTEGRAFAMDVWEMFSELCRRVVEDQNVYLDVNITATGIELMLMPLYEDEEEI